MNTKDKKHKILEVISSQSEPIGLLELGKLLDYAYSERSLRRWVAELEKNGLLKKFGQTRGVKYQATGTEEQSQELTGWFSSKSKKIIEQVRRPVYERHPVTYNPAWLEEYKPNKSSYLSNTLIEKLRRAGERAKKEDPAGTYAHQIFERLLIDLSYNSSRLEGNTYSLLDTKKLLLEGESAPGKLDEEKVMILNHKEAIRYIVDNAQRIIIEQSTIMTLHYLLAEGLLENKYVGKIRDHSVRIGGSTYIPLEDTFRLQKYLKIIAEKAAVIDEPYEKSFFLLCHISYLQAFADVNKRTARLCSNIPLITSNLVPQSFNEVDRDDYNSALIAIYELQNVLPLIDIYAFSYLRTCNMYDSTVKSMGFDEIRVRYRHQRRELIRHIILDQLVGEAAQKYIATQIGKNIPLNDRQAIAEDILEDLELIDVSRIAGLGITANDLEIWQKKSRT